MIRSIGDLNISQKHKKQLQRAMSRYSNQFAEGWIFPSFSADVDAYPHLFKREDGSFLHFDLSELIDDHLSEAGEWNKVGLQGEAVLFSNPLLVGDYDPSKRVAGKNSGGTPPSQRIRNGNWLVLTYEVDDGTVDSLEMQLDWFAGKPEKCPFAKVHKALSEYVDYRGYSAVFSGNKSLHIHLIFDVRHLNKMNMKGVRGHHKKLWTQDVPDSLLAPLYRQVWIETAQVLQEKLNTSAIFDHRLSSYVQKRRSPWGLRTLNKGSELHGFASGDQVRQIVLQERTSPRTVAPKGASPLFCASKVKKMVGVARTSDNRPSTHRVGLQNKDRVLSELHAYLLKNASAPFPIPVDVCSDGEYNMVFFRNDETDVHPSTFVRGDYRKLICAGKSAPSHDVFLPNELTLDETLALLPSSNQMVRTAHRAVGTLPVMGKPLIRAVDKQSARSQASSIFNAVATQQWPTLVQGPEGLGKTHSLMKAVYDLAIADDEYLVSFTKKSMHLSRGFTCFASRSEAQLIEKRAEFNAIHGGERSAILLPSLSSLYAQARLNTNTFQVLSREDAGDADAASFLHLIKTSQPAVFAEMQRLRDDIWLTPDDRIVFDPNAVVFMVHGLLKVWPHAAFTKGFLHPDCPADLDAEKMQQCAQQMSFRRVIYDEVSIEDLVAVVPEWKRDVAQLVKENCEAISGCPWDESALSDRTSAYQKALVQTHRQKEELSFDDCDQIIRLKLSNVDRVTVNVDAFPFGNGGNEQNIYRMVNGSTFYCKPWRWFWSLKCPVVVLTTEDLPRLVVNGINQSKHGKKQRFAIVNMTDTPHLYRDFVPLVFDERARGKRSDKDDAIDLAKDLLGKGFEYVISNSLNPSDPSWNGQVMSHEAARGANSLRGAKIASILLYPSQDHYAELCAIATAFGITDPMTAFYRDQIHQTLGRNLGFRRSDDQSQDSHVVFIKPTLFRDLNMLKGQTVPRVGTDRYSFYVSDIGSI